MKSKILTLIVITLLTYTATEIFAIPKYQDMLFIDVKNVKDNSLICVINPDTIPLYGDEDQLQVALSDIEINDSNISYTKEDIKILKDYLDMHNFTYYNISIFPINNEIEKIGSSLINKDYIVVTVSDQKVTELISSTRKMNSEKIIIDAKTLVVKHDYHEVIIYFLKELALIMLLAFVIKYLIFNIINMSKNNIKPFIKINFITQGSQFIIAVLMYFNGYGYFPSVDIKFQYYLYLALAFSIIEIMYYQKFFSSEKTKSAIFGIVANSIYYLIMTIIYFA